ncbi:MAG: molybdenum cofactor biosynthesis protein MoaE [Deltaproteobacteria bacterium]|nr:molybdenum cofactor biosynthesis protein MoaE [Deltaproteobacteria bacterium]
MNIQEMIQKARKHHDAQKVGMIVSHLGIVRGTSRKGLAVKHIEVLYDHDKVNSIVNDIKNMPGIIEVLVDTREGLLEIGDEILAVVIAGDIRENVFHALITAVNRIKAEASKKKEMLKS